MSPGTGPLYCGVDVGASATKLVLVDSQEEVRARVVRPSGVDYAATARSCLDAALTASGGDQSLLARTVATGYGRRNVAFADATMTEIHCHGRGSFQSFAAAHTVLDIGGQDNKVIRIDGAGNRVDFKMNRKCAAGTGAFIEEIALRLGIELAAMNGLAASAERAVHLGSFCTVFAKTEILAHLRRGEAVAGIVRGAFESVITRLAEMAALQGELVLTGGVVAHNPCIADLLTQKVGSGVTVSVSPHPQFTGALGAALTAQGQLAEKPAAVSG